MDNYKNLGKLNNPTVKEMIDFLNTLEPDMSFIIDDPDTGWDIHIIHCYQQNRKFYVTGEYTEMN